MTCWRDQGVRPGRRCPAAAVRSGDDLQQVAIGVVEVDPAPTVPSVDPIAFFAEGVGPVGEALFENAGEYCVEFVLVYLEGVVLRRDFAVGLDKVQRGVVAHLDHCKRAEHRVRRQAQNRRQEPSRALLVVRSDDGVVQMDGHGFDPFHADVSLVTTLSID